MSREPGYVRPTRTLGAAALLVVGAIHTMLAFDGYGTADLQILFFLNGITSGLVAAAIVVTRHPISSIAGMGVAAGTLVAFAASRAGLEIVGFQGSGLHPSPEAPAALIAEVAVLALLGATVFFERDQLMGALRRAWPFD